jgi:hypothetical protein
MDIIINLILYIYIYVNKQYNVYVSRWVRGWWRNKLINNIYMMICLYVNAERGLFLIKGNVSCIDVDSVVNIDK